MIPIEPEDFDLLTRKLRSIYKQVNTILLRNKGLYDEDEQKMIDQIDDDFLSIEFIFRVYKLGKYQKEVKIDDLHGDAKI